MAGVGLILLSTWSIHVKPCWHIWLVHEPELLVRYFPARLNFKVMGLQISLAKFPSLLVLSLPCFQMKLWLDDCWRMHFMASPHQLLAPSLLTKDKMLLFTTSRVFPYLQKIISVPTQGQLMPAESGRGSLAAELSCHATHIFLWLLGWAKIPLAHW